MAYPTTPAVWPPVKPHRRAIRYADQHVPPLGHDRRVKPANDPIAEFLAFVERVGEIVAAINQAARPVMARLNEMQTAWHNGARRAAQSN